MITTPISHYHKNIQFDYKASNIGNTFQTSFNDFFSLLDERFLALSMSMNAQSQQIATELTTIIINQNQEIENLKQDLYNLKLQLESLDYYNTKE